MIKLLVVIMLIFMMTACDSKIDPADDGESKA